MLYCSERMNIMKTCNTILLCIIVLFTLSSCTTNPSVSDTTSTTSTGFNDSIVVEEYNETTADTTAIKVNGIIYRNKFQGDLILQNLKYSEDVVLQNTIGKFHRIEGTKYDLLYNANSEVTGASESVYCRDDQWQELKKYYSDSNNFTFQCIVKNDNHSVEAIDVDKIDIVKLNELLAFCNENKYEPNLVKRQPNLHPHYLRPPPLLRCVDMQYDPSTFQNLYNTHLLHVHTPN